MEKVLGGQGSDLKSRLKEIESKASSKERISQNDALQRITNMKREFEGIPRIAAFIKLYENLEKIFNQIAENLGIERKSHFRYEKLQNIFGYLQISTITSKIPTEADFKDNDRIYTQDLYERLQKLNSLLQQVKELDGDKVNTDVKKCREVTDVSLQLSGRFKQILNNIQDKEVYTNNKVKIDDMLNKVKDTYFGLSVLPKYIEELERLVECDKSVIVDNVKQEENNK